MTNPQHAGVCDVYWPGPKYLREEFLYAAADAGVGKAKGEDDAHLRGEMYVLPNASNASTYMPVASGPRRGYLAHGHAGGGVRTIQVGGPLQRTVTLDAEEAPTARSTIIHRQGVENA